jgi:putative membrane protein
MDLLEFLKDAAPFAAIAVALLVVFRFVFDRLTPYDDRAIAKSGNSAARITRWGAYLGYLTAVMGSLVMSGQPYWTDVMMFAADGVVALIVFAIAYYAIDLTILRRINNAGEIEKGNRAVAKVEFCGFVALGIIMNASFAGGGDRSPVTGMGSAALFSFIGLISVMLAYTVYTVAWAARGCSLDTQILKGNRAAAIEAGSLLLAFSTTLWFSIIGDFAGWSDDIKSYAIAAGFSVVVVSAARSVTSLLLRKMGRTQKGVHHASVAKATIVGLVSILAGLGAGLYVYI